MFPNPTSVNGVIGVNGFDGVNVIPQPLPNGFDGVNGVPQP